MTCLKSVYDNTDMEEYDVEIVVKDNSINNLGYPSSMNELVTRCNGEFIIMLNDDSKVIDPDWINKMLNQYYTYTKEHDTKKIIMAQGCHRSGQGVWYCPFWNTMMKREHFADIGFLDEDFGVGMYDDIDFSWRATSKGYRIVTAPMVVEHTLGGSSIRDKIKKYEGIDYNKLKDKNTKLFEDKWRDELKLMNDQTEGR